MSVSHTETPTDGGQLDDELADAIDRQRLAARVREAVDTLPPDERKAVQETLFRHRTNAEVGTDMGVTAARVSQLKNAGIRRLAGHLENERTHDRR